MTPSWTEIRAAWSATWKKMETDAYEKYGPTIERQPMRYAGEAESFFRNLQVSRTNLSAAAASMDALKATDEVCHALYLPKYIAWENHYNALAAGAWANSTLEDTSVGVAPVVPVVVVVLGVGLTAVGVAWAVAYREYAVAAKKETALLAEELRARVAASQQGRTLPPATIERVPPPTPPTLSLGGGSGEGLLLGGLLVAAALGGGVLYLRNR